MGRLEIKDWGGLELILSERNLLSLLSKLYTPGSAAAIVIGDVPPGYNSLLISAERDEKHYSSESREGEPAGIMHPVTERVLAAIRTILREEELEIE